MIDYFYILTLLGVLALGLVLYQEFRIRRIKKESLSQRENIQRLSSDKEILLKEAQHRVKNNMQMISSLINIQERNAANEEAKSALEKSKSRIKSIALIHQGLLTDNRPQHVSAQEYVKSLSASVFNAYKQDKEHIALRTEVDNVYLHIDTGLPLGLILNELLTNCLKFTFTESEPGEIIVRLSEQDKKLILEVEDSGTPLSTEELENRVGVFGNKMIETFKSRLDSSLNLASEGSNKVRLSISNYQVDHGE